MKIILYLGSAILLYCLSILAAVSLSALFEWYISVEGTLLLALVITIAIIAVLRFAKGRSLSCPQCKRSNAMEETSYDIISSIDTFTTVDQPIKDKNNGKITGWYTQRVPAVMYTIDHHEKCRYCGHERTVRRSETHQK